MLLLQLPWLELGFQCLLALALGVSQVVAVGLTTVDCANTARGRSHSQLGHMRDSHHGGEHGLTKELGHCLGEHLWNHSQERVEQHAGHLLGWLHRMWSNGLQLLIGRRDHWLKVAD